MKEIEIVIDKDGKVDVEAKNFKGVGCEEALKALVDGLGTCTGSHNKIEYGAPQEVFVKQQI